jgi:alpha-ketoglutarate-dependent taurine dioxygenase
MESQEKPSDLFEAYARMPAAERALFRGMVDGYEYKEQAASNAGKKAAETKRKHAASGAGPTAA